ncbi:MAG: TRAM domain-containing protein, partial [Deltaproteobacteria bacterium]|nr:TRAM domain-containing protein [Deltaproteobacteria bacterium]
MDLNTMPQAGRPEPGSRHEVTVERVAALGRGVARLEGLTVLASRAIPGERVTVELEQVRPRHALGRVVAVHSPAPERVTPPCAHYAECGGCDWQHVAYPTQVIFKRQVLLEQLERIGGVSLPVAFTLHPAEPTLAYRDKLEFVPVSAAEGGVPRPGFAGLADQTRVAVDPCLLAPPEYTRLAAAALAALARAGMPDPMRTVRRLTVQGTLGADGAPALALTLHMADASALAAAGERREPLLEGLRQSGIAVALVGLSAPGRGHAGPMRRNLLGPEWLIKG